MTQTALRRRGAPHRSAHGFTLIETVLTLVVLAIVGAVVMVPFMVSLRHSAEPVFAQQAVLLAQEKLEQIVADRLDKRTPRGFVFATTPNNYPVENLVIGMNGYTRSVAIQCVTAGNLDVGAAPAAASSCARSNLPVAGTDYARVTVTVSNAALGAVTARTLLTNY